MQIYIIDDKKTEIEKASNAVVVAGHEVSSIGISRTGSISYFNKTDNISELSVAWDATNEVFLAIEKMKEVGGGIITDMMFHLATASPEDPIPPSGILVVLHALSAGVPVVVCTNASEVGGHHAKALHWIYDGYILPAQLRGTKLPFGWVENKDWDAAIKLLEQLHAQKNM